MSFNINIINKMGSKGSSINKSTVNRQKTKITETKKSRVKSLDTKISSGIDAVNSGLNLAMGKSAGVGLTKVAGVTGAIIGASISLASKGHDLYMGIQRSKTGNSVYYDNIKVRKDAIMSLGMNYITGAFRNHINIRHEIARENTSLDYLRDIYNLNNFGEKNKIR